MIVLLVMLDILSILFVTLEIFQIVEYIKIAIACKDSGVNIGKVKKNIQFLIILIVMIITVAVMLIC